MRKLLFGIAVLVLLGILSASAIVRSVPRSADERQIERAVYQGSYAAKSTAKLRVKFFPIKIVGNWAKASCLIYDQDPYGKEIPPSFVNEADLGGYILKKSSGKWRIVVNCYVEGIMPSQCQKIGLPVATARKLGVVVFQIASGAEERAIKQDVLRATHFKGLYKYDGGVAKTKAKFEPIKIAGGWASAHYSETSHVPGIEELPSNASYILKKTGGKWRTAYKLLEGCMMPKECKKIGLSAATVRKLGFQVVPDANDGEIGHVIH